MASYEQLAEDLGSDLMLLKVDDFINFRAATGYVQVIQNPDRLTAELRFGHRTTPEDRAALVANGWEEPRLGEPTWLLDVAWPLSAGAARAFASHIVEVTRAFVAADIITLEYDARNYDTWEPLDLPSLRDLRRTDDTGQR